MVYQPRSQGSLLPALRSEREREGERERERGRVGENPGNEVEWYIFVSALLDPEAIKVSKMLFHIMVKLCFLFRIFHDRFYALILLHINKRVFGFVEAGFFL